ncbi:MAG TPA: hypothetical protein PLD27_00985 [bacterium]|nr:hypothetical protein [bacterium]HOL48483.1 hypothetical protein [bacterium]HPQ17711.1 hypothetical protein [bacterium]
MKQIIKIIIYLFLITNLFSDEINYGFIYRIIKEKTEYREQILGPIYNKNISDTTEEIDFLFYKSYRDTSKNKETKAYLYPFIQQKKSDISKSFFIFPIYSYTAVKHNNDTEFNDVDLFLLPSIFYGYDKKEGNYFAFFPIAGNMKGKLGKEEINFFLFPLYLKTKYKDDIIKNYFYPFIAFADNENLHIKKFFPFYGEIERKGKYEKKFVMYPFYQERNNYINNQKYTSKIYFPIYGIENYPGARYKSYLYPIIRYKENDFKNNFSILPFIIKERSYNYSKTYYSFIYGEKEDKTNKVKSGYYLFPIGHFHYQEKNDGYYKDNYFLPFIKYYKKYEKEDKQSVFQFFPLFKVNKNNGLMKLSIPSLEIFLKGNTVEKKYSNLWNFIRIEKNSNEFILNILWSFIEFQKNKQENFVMFNVNPLIKIKKQEEKTEIALFFGLIELQ